MTTALGASSEREVSKMDNNIYNIGAVLEETGETTEWKMPKGKKAVDFVISLSENMRPEVHQKYITLGVLCSSFPDVDSETIISMLKEAGKWED
tara:strand:- start:305 stop:586 length:282 start_codon:yes stop_codon:yes gene_type:complete